VALISGDEGMVAGARPRATHADGVVRFLLAAGISYYGDWLTTVALVVLLFRLTGTATAPALYILARVAPRVLGPAPGGALADRFGPARLAALCGLAQGGLTAAIVVLAAAHLVWPIYLAVALAQFLGSMAQPAYNAVIPFVARPARLKQVNALYTAILETCMLVAPGLGALLLLANVAPQLLILGDAASFLVAAGLLLTLRTAGHGDAQDLRSGGMFVGVAMVRADAMLRVFAIGHLCTGAVITALQAVLVVAAAQRFGHDTNVGWLYAAVGAGGLVASLTLLRWAPTNVRRLGIASAVLGELIPLGLFAIVSSLGVAMALLFVSSLFGALYQTRGAIALQERVPRGLLGRVNAVVRFALYLGMLIGAVVAAAAAAWVSWDRLLLYVTAAAALALLATVLTGPQEAPLPPAEVALAGRATTSAGRSTLVTDSQTSGNREVAGGGT
jgi:MFS family permease